MPLKNTSCIFFLILCFFTSKSFASVCPTDVVVQHDTITFTSPVKVEADAKIGTVIAKVKSAGVALDVSCPSKPLTYARYLKGEPTGMKEEEADIYTTNIPGIGIALCFVECMHDSRALNFAQYAVEGWQTSYPGANTHGIQYHTASLVVIGPISPGILTGGVYGALGVDSNTDIETVSLNSVEIQGPSCSIDQKNLNIRFGSVPLDKFKGAGSVSDNKDFQLSFTCNQTTNIHITLQASQNNDTSDNSIIALTNVGSPGVSDGLGLQILYDNNPLKIGENTSLTNISGSTSKTLNFQTRYYQVKSRVTPGEANATATLNFIYQ